jgi:titin
LKVKAANRKSVLGYPTPTVSWLKNNQELPSNCEVKYEHNKVTLILRDLVVEDAGRYSCKLENEAGTACSTADIVVKSMFLISLN